MREATRPFTDPDLVAGSLYATVGRLAQRIGELPAAKISGGDATTTIVDLVAQPGPAAPDGVRHRLWTRHHHPAVGGPPRTRTADQPPEPICSPERLRVYTEFTICSQRYLHSNGYRHTWPEVRPWWESEDDPVRLRGELVQVAAVAIQWIQAIDHLGLPAAAES